MFDLKKIRVSIVLFCILFENDSNRLKIDIILIGFPTTAPIVAAVAKVLSETPVPFIVASCWEINE